MENKKKGRPKNIVVEEEPRVLKKRGRKPKIKEEVEKKEPKKRGRRPKSKVYSIINEKVNFTIENLSDNLLHLNKIKEDVKNINIENNYNDNNIIKFEPYEKDNLYEMIQNKVEEDISINMNNMTIKEDVPKFINKNKKYEMLPQLYKNPENWPKKTDIHCWWCCYEFEGIPIPLPIKYEKKDENGYFVTNGCFCSFNCVLGYSKEKKINNKPLVNFLYKKMSKSKEEIKIKEAPNKYLLDIFGGPLTIEEYRESFYNSTNYYLLPYPLIGRLDNISVESIINNKVNESPNIQLKRAKPLSMTKNTLEHFMSISK